MRRQYTFRKSVEKIIDQMAHHRPNVATVHSVEDRTVSLTLGGFPSIVREVRVIGDIDKLKVGDTVDILWDKGRPVVLVGGFSSSSDAVQAVVNVDNRTLEGSYEGLRVKRGGIGMHHLDFVPALDGHTHEDPIRDAGWEVSPGGVLFNGNTKLHPDGRIVLGDGSEIISLASDDPEFRLWAGTVHGQSAPFSIDRQGAMRALLGEIGGWEIGADAIQADNGQALIDSRTPAIRLGEGDYLQGAGFWAGKHGSVYRLKIGNQERFLRWDGHRLLIQGDLRSADFIPGTQGWNITAEGEAEFHNALVRGQISADSGDVGGWLIDNNKLSSGQLELNSDVPSIAIGATGFLSGQGFWVGEEDGVGKLYIGSEESFIAWDGDNLFFAADLQSSNFVSGVAGWRLDPAGNAELHNVIVRGSLRSSAIEHEQVLALDGGFIAAKSATTIAQGFTIGEDNLEIVLNVPSGAAPEDVTGYYLAGDVIRVKQGFVNLWAQVISVTEDFDNWLIIIEKLDPTEEDVSIQAGSTLINYGSSGDGAIELAGHNPHIRMFTHAGAPHQSVDNFLILGDLQGQFGVEGSQLGLGVGDPGMLEDYLVVTEDGLRMSGEIKVGAHSYAVGTGFYVGKVNDIPYLRIGDPHGDHILWDGQTISVVGTINIMGGSLAGELDGLGALAMQDSVDYDAVTGEKPPGNATHGAIWGVNLDPPDRFKDPVAGDLDSGLYLTSDYMGYYDDSDGMFKTFIHKTGYFRFAGGGQDTFIEWNPSTNKLYGYGDNRIQWYASSEDGRLYTGDGSVVLDEMGIRILGDRAAFYYVDEEQPDTPVGTMRIARDIANDKVIRIINGLDASEDNVVPNSDFETDTSGWVLETDGNVVPSRSTEKAYTGSASLKFEPFVLQWQNLLTEEGETLLTEDDEELLVLSPSHSAVDRAYSEPIQIEPNMQYVFMTRVYWPDKAYLGLSVKLKLYDEFQNPVRERVLPLESLARDTWAQVQDIFVSASNEAYLVIEFELDQGIGGDDDTPEGLFVDQVELYALSAHDSQIELGLGYVNLDADEVVIKGKYRAKEERPIYLKVRNEDEEIEALDGALYFTVPKEYDGFFITDVHAAVYQPSTSGNIVIQLRNLTIGQDLLTTRTIVDQGDYASYVSTTTPAVSETYNSLSAGDRIRVDVDEAGQGVLGLDVIISVGAVE